MKTSLVLLTLTGIQKNGNIFLSYLLFSKSVNVCRSCYVQDVLCDTKKRFSLALIQVVITLIVLFVYIHDNQ